ncbi:MAG: undecaprenyldiphospho-muramoylpentapeptide beta-N-acetylglucosaminyltransferase [Clostridia bacterium]|nr:undecaprenyldiphospho-muramoylpentapeptide beta-N-acetylglucosaminyltransferase [Clostridia bacterium]
MKIVFAAGGTGGHINPALSAAGEVQRRYPDAEILFIGTADHMEARLVPAAGFAFKTIEIAGFQRKPTPKNILKNIKTVGLLFKSTGEVKKILKHFAPDVVVGFGGYVSGPVLRTAAKMGIKTAIHEQNAYPGVTNKALAKTADAVMLTVEAAKAHFPACKVEPIVTGLPVRHEILEADRDFARAALSVPDNAMLILSMGGSLGAKAINEAMTELIAARYTDKDLFFLHATGKYGKWVPDKLREQGVNLDKAKNVIIREYIDDMDTCLAAADLVIGRAGASSLSEIEATGKASILIPSPNVAENHQYHNAMALVNNGAAQILEEKDLTAERLISMVDALKNDRQALQALGENAKKMAVTDSAKVICDMIVSLAQPAE